MAAALKTTEDATITMEVAVEVFEEGESSRLIEVDIEAVLEEDTIVVEAVVVEEDGMIVGGVIEGAAAFVEAVVATRKTIYL